MKQSLSSYKNLYIETAKVYLHNLEKDIEILSKDPKDNYALQDTYICAHSLKSQSAVMGFIEVETLSQVIERLFHDIRENKIMLTGELLTLLKHALHGLNRSILHIEKDNTEENLSEHRRNLLSIGVYEKDSHH